MTSNKLSPFNSQNTFLAGAMLKDYILYPHIGRIDDIWVAYYAQAMGYRVVYGGALVYQDRNIHDPMRDMKQGVSTAAGIIAVVEEGERRRLSPTRLDLRQR